MIATLLSLLISVPAPAPPATELEAALAVLDTLDGTSISVDYQDETLKAVLTDLGSRVPVPLRADWDSLERLGVHPDDRVSLHINPTTATTVLAGLALAIGDEYERPQFEVHAGQMVLTTVVATAAMRVTGTYDVRDLLKNAGLLKQLTEPESATIDREPADRAPGQPQPAEPAGVQPPEPVPGPGDPPGGHRPQHPARIPAMPPMEVAGPRHMSPGERLFTIITDHIDPEAWMNFGGERALISELDGVLMITASPTIHRRFRNALDALRAANAPNLGIDAFILQLPRADLDRINRESSKNSPAHLAALLADTAGQTLWKAATMVAMDARLALETSANSSAVHIALEPRQDDATGTLSIALEASTRQTGDDRSIKTTVSLLPDQAGTVLELPSGKPGAAVQLLVLTIKR